MDLNIKKWLEHVNVELSLQIKKQYPKMDMKIEANQGKKYIKLVSYTDYGKGYQNGGSAWGFVSLTDGTLKGSHIKYGDLLKAANWSSPARHSRGNIFDGTARYSQYGPEYLK
jgi:hypothetical protein